ncbi:SPOR domain-containing protein [Thiosulfativibrio zosterae]|uniref:SPOR domain-containing protein n=1 Tax=Thiosulfativibrio zosterae TaxID=2675053 RepID=A0A6F8PQF2_9GAMM|nr:SPOR domain-containing protein [Thiosulfativibrio zosterae]BBP44257.1 hypothetical protein THMIRHAT_20030 [Thiosulfativibrio zosterae]
MAGDLRHGYGGSHKKPYQRKSQQVAEESSAGSSVRLVWVAATFLALGLVLGYFVVYHFATEGVGTRQEAQAKASVEEIKTPDVAQAKEVVAEPEEASPQQPLNVVAITPATASAKTAQPLEYSFYHGLSETEVLVDAEPIPVTLPVPYYIQAGTFGSAEQAQKEKARLARMGQAVEVSIYQGKKLYYRLRMGPFDDRLELNKKRNELNRLGVDTLLVKSSLKTVAKSEN